jgi:hypothetical protein
MRVARLYVSVDFPAAGLGPGGTGAIHGGGYSGLGPLSGLVNARARRAAHLSDRAAWVPGHALMTSCPALLFCVLLCLVVLFSHVCFYTLLSSWHSLERAQLRIYLGLSACQ